MDDHSKLSGINSVDPDWLKSAACLWCCTFSIPAAFPVKRTSIAASSLAGLIQGGIKMLPASGFHRALSEVAPALSRRFFTCSSRTQCGLWTEVQTTHEIQRLAHLGRRQFGTSRSATVKPEYNTVRPGPNPATLLRSQQSTKTQSKLARTFSTSVRSRSAATTIEAIEDVARSEAGKGSSFPKTSTNTVAYWLLGSAASVFGIVVFGGLTRLTESG